MIAFALYGCKQQTSEIITEAESFTQKWYTGKAEISSYSLHQARYGEMRDGEATLIFVSEDFSTDKLVKPDDPDATNDKVKILKMNMTKNFITGIYPYSMMLSVFKPITADANKRALKVNCSSQEWCGQTFSQLQLNGNKYNWQLHSYFEKEGEEEKSLNAALLEDELWNHIRINPLTLPVGRLKMIAGLVWQRLSHTSMQQQDAILNVHFKETVGGIDSTIKTLTIQYPAFNRTLKIDFENIFPFKILGWSETYPDGFGNNKRLLTTTATLKKTIWLDYWKHNANKDTIYRDSLRLKRYE